MILFLILLNAALGKSQLISICSDITCSYGCKTYSGPTCISYDNSFIHVSSQKIDMFSDSLCSMPILNTTQPLYIDNRCHTFNNTYYVVSANADKTIFILIPIFILIVIGLLCNLPQEKPKVSLNEPPAMRD